MKTRLLFGYTDTRALPQSVEHTVYIKWRGILIRDVFWSQQSQKSNQKKKKKAKIRLECSLLN